MFLGHWYLNTPSMELAPLEKLILVLFAAIVLRATVCGVGTVLQFQSAGISNTQWILIALRWAAGIFGAAVLGAMARQTLRIPNTQSATGILYVAVVAT